MSELLPLERKSEPLPVRVFIGSSSEGKDYAKIICEIIQSHSGFEVLPWWEVFSVGSTNMENLVDAMQRADAAVFVATPDDQRKMRGGRSFVMRDNVLFEYGLFIGNLGRNRVALANVENVDIASDLHGVTHISLPKRNLFENWNDYKGRFDTRKLHGWLVQLQGSRLHFLMSWDSERTAKKKKIFLDAAKESKIANYLVIRARDLLSEEGEINELCKSPHDTLRIKLLMVNFEELDQKQFNSMVNAMHLSWYKRDPATGNYMEDPDTKSRIETDLATERAEFSARLRFARQLKNTSGMSFECRLLPASMIPEMKLRLYDACGYFSFYRRMGTADEIHGRTLFGVDDRSQARTSPRSPLLTNLQQMYDRLWEGVEDYNRDLKNLGKIP
jgi:hypothetical protein